MHEASAKAPAFPSRAYAWFVIGIVMFASIVAYVDRQLVAIVVGPMKHDLGVTDSQVGLLYGVFSVFFAFAALPIGWMAARWSRKIIMATGVFLWSLATAATGFSTSFAQVFAARIGVGVGEAAITPALHSMVGDIFPRERIPLALSVYQMGSVIGSGLAFVIGGAVLAFAQNMSLPDWSFIAGLKPWQLTFLIVGAPGAVLAFFMLFMREPARRALAEQTAKGSLGELWRFYKENALAITLHHVGFLALSLMGYGFTFWTVSYFTRVHGMEAAQASQIFGWIFLIAGPFGAVWAAKVAEGLAKKGRGDANLLGAMLGAAISIPIIFLIQVAPNPWIAFALYAPAMFFVSSPYGLAYGSLPVIAPPPIRAMVAAVFMLVISLGMMLGPPMAGLFNERLFPTEEGVRFSVATVTIVFGALGLGLLALCLKPYGRMLAAADAAERSPAASPA